MDEDFTILDIGCGGGRTIGKLASMTREGKVYGVDISEDSVEVARNHNRKLVNEGKVEIRVSGVSELPFEGDYFDLVTAVETHFYWPNLLADLGEVLRVTKPDDTLLVIGGEYLGSRFDERNRNWAEKIGMGLHTLEEFKELWLMCVSRTWRFSRIMTRVGFALLEKRGLHNSEDLVRARVGAPLIAYLAGLGTFA